MSILIKNRKRIEIDFDAQKIPLLRRMIDAAPWRVRWDYKGLSRCGFFGTQRDWNQTLINRVDDISTQIRKSTKENANTLIVSIEILSILKDNEKFKCDGGRLFFGNHYEIFVNKYLQSNVMIVCRMVSNEEDWFKNNRLMGTILVDGMPEHVPIVPSVITEDIKVSKMEILDRKYILIVK